MAEKFWADRIKELKHDPEARLRMALQYLPLPAAFREAAISIRALVRQRRGTGEDHADLLDALYRLAVEESFLFSTPFLPGIGPAFNVAEQIPEAELKALEFPYAEIGYTELGLLNKTDVKWLIGAWGEPEKHQTAQSHQEECWSTYVARVAKQVERHEKNFEQRLMKMADDIHSELRKK